MPQPHTPAEFTVRSHTQGLVEVSWTPVEGGTSITQQFALAVVENSTPSMCELADVLLNAPAPCPVRALTPGHRLLERYPGCQLVVTALGTRRYEVVLRSGLVELVELAEGMSPEGIRCAVASGYRYLTADRSTVPGAIGQVACEAVLRSHTSAAVVTRVGIPEPRAVPALPPIADGPHLDTAPPLPRESPGQP